MKYLSVVEFAKKLNLSERTVRNYCSTGKLKGSFLTGKTWNIPEDAVISKKKKRKYKCFIGNSERTKEYEAKRWYLPPHADRFNLQFE
ncbi:helix-turn-helix domain-containing protein [Flavobacterium fluviatile]|uniref:helix-turn-helix domain-containing protein n=1 Tax=Flavobacterium fluviatile TaxID=1862387 RepID=UPI001AD7D2A1|nr:helix-turn-helix domain-containing protein [Flavobacterium fluviatile]